MNPQGTPQTAKASARRNFHGAALAMAGAFTVLLGHGQTNQPPTTNASRSLPALNLELKQESAPAKSAPPAEPKTNSVGDGPGRVPKAQPSPAAGIQLTNLDLPVGTIIDASELQEIPPVKAAQTNESVQGIRELTAKAEKGDADAQCELGRRYLHGEGVETNDVTAELWLRKAAEKKHAQAQYWLGESYYQRAQALHFRGLPVIVNEADLDEFPPIGKTKLLGPPRAAPTIDELLGPAPVPVGEPEVIEPNESSITNYQEAAKWFRLAADAGLAKAQFRLGFLYQIGYGVAEDATTATKYYRMAAEQGHVEAQVSLGVRCQYGMGGPTNLVEAVKWYRRAAEQGHTTAQIILGLACRHGGGTPTNHIEAIKWFRKAADNGDSFGEYLLGEIYESGKGVPKDESQAADWFRKAADHGESNAQYSLGLMYQDGRGVPQDSDEAIKWFLEAAENGNANARRKLAWAYFEGDGVAKNHTEAVKWFLRLVEQWPSPDSQAALGWLHAHGEGIERDFAKAAEWYRKAAERGHAGAQLNLGSLYYNGHGVKQNWTEAAKWFRKAADQGDAAAQSYLGMLYKKGEGVFRDYTEAVRWYRKAADQGDEVGQLNLAGMYVRGFGVPQDYVEAYRWYNLAATGGNSEAIEARNNLVRWMTREQIAEAQRRSAAFVARKESAKRESGTALDSEPNAAKNTGTGFFITEDGYLLTNFHVVDEADSITVRTKQGTFPATLVKADKANDIAVLKVSGRFTALPLAPSRSVKLGDSVFTIGFPNTAIQGIEPKLTRGDISSLAGVQDDPRHFQISVAVQPGNSGGPLVDRFGNVVGIVTFRLSDLKTLAITGTIPQTVNYAVKSSFILAFIETMPDLAARLKDPHPSNDRKSEDVTQEAQQAVALVLVY